MDEMIEKFDEAERIVIGTDLNRHYEKVMLERIGGWRSKDMAEEMRKIKR